MEMDAVKRCILLVDDDPAVVSYLTTKLSKIYEVVGTARPEQAVALARRHLPDAILCDIDMPGMGGGEVARALGEDAMLARIPFLYLSDLVSPDETRELQGFVGGRPGVAKRAPLAELVARIDELTRS
jgi:CheY-like chemotaxis protein